MLNEKPRQVEVWQGEREEWRRHSAMSVCPLKANHKYKGVLRGNFVGE